MKFLNMSHCLFLFHHKNMNMDSSRMIIGILKIFCLLAATFSCGDAATKDEVMSYLRQITGRQTISGHHNREPNSDPTRYTRDVTRITNGMVPGLYSGDFLFCPEDVSQRQTMVNETRRQWEAGSLVHFSFNICPPTVGEECTWSSQTTCPPGGDGETLNGNGDGTQVQSSLTNAQWEELVTDGSPLNERWKRRMDVYMYFLNQLSADGVVSIIRPFHEMNGNWYWWSSGTTEQYIKLWQLTHNFMNPRVPNLIWNWVVADPPWLETEFGRTWEEFYPGPDYVDIVGLSIYEGAGSKQPTDTMYQRIRSIAQGKIIAIGECGQIPTPETLGRQNEWSYFMNWADYVTDPDWNTDPEVRRTYNDPRVLKQGQLQRFS